MIDTTVEALTSLQTNIAQIRSLIEANQLHLLKLMHVELVAAAVIVALQSIALGLAIHTQRLHKKMRSALSLLTDNQEKRLQILMARIEILEKATGLRPIDPDTPPPPQVLM